MPYDPAFNAAVYATRHLEVRARILLCRQVNGTLVQRRSVLLAGELATINAELRKRTDTEPATAAPRNVAFKRLTATPRTAHRRALGVSPDADVARAAWQPYTPTAGPRLATGYSGAVRSVNAGFSPKPHSQYR